MLLNPGLGAASEYFTPNNPLGDVNSFFISNFGSLTLLSTEASEISGVGEALSSDFITVTLAGDCVGS